MAAPCTATTATLLALALLGAPVLAPAVASEDPSTVEDHETSCIALVVICAEATAVAEITCEQHDGTTFSCTGQAQWVATGDSTVGLEGSMSWLGSAILQWCPAGTCAGTGVGLPQRTCTWTPAAPSCTQTASDTIQGWTFTVETGTCVTPIFVVKTKTEASLAATEELPVLARAEARAEASVELCP